MDFETYPLAESVLSLEVWDHTDFDSPVNPLHFPRGLAASHLSVVASDHRHLIVQVVCAERSRSLAELSQVVGLHVSVVTAVPHSRRSHNSTSYIFRSHLIFDIQ